MYIVKIDVISSSCFVQGERYDRFVLGAGGNGRIEVTENKTALPVTWQEGHDRISTSSVLRFFEVNDFATFHHLELRCTGRFLQLKATVYLFSIFLAHYL